MAGNAVSPAVSGADPLAETGGPVDTEGAASDSVQADAVAEPSVLQRYRAIPRAVCTSPDRLGLAVWVSAIAVLSSLAIWFGYLLYNDHQSQGQRAAFLAAGRQGAIDVTTVDYTRIEADIARVVAASTGVFRDEFQTRSPAFTDEMRRTKSKSVGSVVEAAVESMEKDAADVIVAVKVTTTQEGNPDSRVKGWRMRVSVQRVGADLKVSKVDFVP